MALTQGVKCQIFFEFNVIDEFKRRLNDVKYDDVKAVILDITKKEMRIYKSYHAKQKHFFTNCSNFRFAFS